MRIKRPKLMIGQHLVEPVDDGVKLGDTLLTRLDLQQMLTACG